MTSHKHLKQLVRARMSRTGERYAAARRQILAQAQSTISGPAAAHLPGNVPATTALRILLCHLRMKAPDSTPLSEELTFVLAGGIGAGTFAFLYEKEDWASLFLGGRHLWQDDQTYLVAAGKRLGLKAVIKESSGAKPAEKQLRDALAIGGPVIAWVDSAHLPHRALPAQWSGSGYHIITIYAIDDERALIGDLTDDPVEISLKDLATARMRIKKQKNRLLWFEKAKPAPVEPALLDHGLKACATGLTNHRMKNFRLEGFADLAARMTGDKGKESWGHMFPAGGRLWSALTWLYTSIEHYGTGGGLCRSLFSEGLTEAARQFGRGNLNSVATSYQRLGQQWTELAEAGLPDSVPACREARQLIALKAELTHSGGDPAEIRRCWDQLKELEMAARKEFPMSSGGVAELRKELSEKLSRIYQSEASAVASLT